MANPWLRLWVDLPNDPKFRTIAKISGQSISSVIAVYIHMLCCASNATERGRTQGWCDEDIATALDLDIEQIIKIRDSMQNRLLEGDYLTGWNKRQPKREDGSAERAQADRDRKKQEKLDKETQSNAIERNQPTDKIREDKIREDEIREDIKPFVLSDAKDSVPCPHQDIIDLYHEILPSCPRIRDWTPARQTHLRARWNEDKSRQSLDYWKRFFKFVADCDFLVGKSGNKPFFADLEWMVKSANFTKIREEKYANR